VTDPSISPTIVGRLAHRSASIAKAGVATAPAAVILAIALGRLGLDHDSRMGTAIFRMLGVVTLTGGVSALAAGVVAFLHGHDRSASTILAIVAGAFLSWLMVVEMFIAG
jgi:hypothetical protein